MTDYHSQSSHGTEGDKDSPSLLSQSSGPNSPIPMSSYSTHAEDYELKSIIGHGSSAIVYLAEYKPAHEVLCIKQVDLDQFERNQIDELRREIQVMSLCRHTNVLPIKASFVHGSKLWIVMPFLASGSCLDIMKVDNPDGFDETIIATILKQALQGLAYLHKNGQIHRDVKAGNLLVAQDGSVMLGDFGVSSSLTEGGDRRSVRKTFVGTPCWMAPEVMEQEKGYDSKADIWSFGITALELANGQAPFAKYPPMKVLLLTLQNPPPTLERDRTKHKYSKTFKELIDSCLQKDPTKRPSAEKLLQHAFFKQAKKPNFLVTSLLEKLPPLEARIKARVRRQTEEYIPEGPSWDFADSGSPHSSSAPANSSTLGPSPPTADGHENETRKGRFIVEPNPPSRPASIYSELPSASNSQENVHHLVGLVQIDEGEVKKGRFSVRGQKEFPNIDKDTDSNGNSEDEKRSRPHLPFGDSTDVKPSSVPSHAVATEESNQAAEEKRGRFQVYAEPMTNNRVESNRFSIQELQDQIGVLLKVHDQQRLLLQDISSKLEQCAVDKMIAACNFERQLNSLRRDAEDLKRENERLRTLSNKL